MDSSSTQPAAQSNAALAAWYLCGRHRLLWNVPLTAALLVFILLMLLHGTMQDPRANLIQSRKALLASAPPKLPDTENAAVDYRLASMNAVRFLGPTEFHPGTILGKDSRLFERADIQAYLSANALALGQLCKAARLARCNWDLNYLAGTAMPMRHLPQMREFARLLAAQARSQAHAGDHAGAVLALSATFALARHVESDRNLLSCLVANAIISVAQHSLQGIILWDPPTDAKDAAAYRAMVLQDTRCFDRVAAAFQGEQTFGLYEMDRLAAGNPAAAAAAAAVAGAMPGPGMEFFLPIQYGADRTCYLNTLNEFVSCSRSRRVISESEFQKIMDSHRAGPAILTQLIVPVLSRCQISFIRAEEAHRAMHAALAVLEYRLKHGHDPRALADLAPEFLKELPRGIFGNEPLRMRMDPEGIRERDGSVHHPGIIRLYFIGENAIDDGGKSNLQGMDNTGDDATFCLPPAPQKAEK